VEEIDGVEHELLYRGEAPKVARDDELPRILREDWEKGKKK
jgi:hypothetical protein